MLMEIRIKNFFMIEIILWLLSLSTEMAITIFPTDYLPNLSFPSSLGVYLIPRKDEQSSLQQLICRKMTILMGVLLWYLF